MSEPAGSEHLPAHLQQLRLEGRFAVARDLLQQAAARHGDAYLAWQAWLHEPFWWQPIQGPRVRLRRRGPADAALLRACWADAGFMRRFNRQAAALPADDAALARLLAREHSDTAESHRALHWTIEHRDQAVGFVSLVDIAFGHRRAELMVGVRPGVPSRATVEATLLLLDAAAGPLRLERLVAHFYPDNAVALSSARKLGFVQEGVLRGHVRDAATGIRTDLIATGLLLEEPSASRAGRLRRRLLGN
jgi:RimJ/RimL family protein N-acetyltransferase